MVTACGGALESRGQGGRVREWSTVAVPVSMAAPVAGPTSVGSGSVSDSGSTREKALPLSPTNVMGH